MSGLDTEDFPFQKSSYDAGHADATEALLKALPELLWEHRWTITSYDQVKTAACACGEFLAIDDRQSINAQILDSWSKHIVQVLREATT